MKPKPNWFRLSSPYNVTGSTNLGMLMTSIQFVKYDGTGQFNPVRTCMEKNVKDTTQYKFYWQILQGFELATNIKTEKLNTQV